MSQVAALITIITGLVGLAIIAGGLYAVIQNTGKDATIERQRKEIADYVARIGFLEPHLVKAEEEVGHLKRLTDPTPRLEGIRGDTVEIRRVVQAIATDVTEIKRAAHGERSDS